MGSEGHAEDDFDHVFCALLPRLYRRAVLLTGQAQAEDAVHEAYLKLRRRPHALVGHPEPYAYAFSALTSVVRDTWKRGRRQVLIEAPTTGWDGGIADRDAELEVARLLSGLTVRQRAAVLLVDLDGYTIDEAADLLGVHRGTVSRSRERALAALRRTLRGGRA
ncbi:RNA polymerase sigma factor [Actinomadura parmotrematis]|uniref:RNA polymerase sigma factor n=1 Tax=Actinomadura parmotrematis TaxID=2864039 RepID=A0ABS7G1K2_9ACTN|nr:RNA polymerase sigma factor [Actinomadura parmotrematis]MBW8486436.1 RNA polymerase sigma factor [Actinomadura parmotrematis]